jgi:four helix bundle protein
MAQLRNPRDLDAWRIAMDLVDLIYDLTTLFPADERFGLSSQMRRAVVSIPSNVAEGNGLKRARWTLRHILTAIGSSWELDTQITIALRRKYVTPSVAAGACACLDRVQKLLYGLKREKERQLASAQPAEPHRLPRVDPV